MGPCRRGGGGNATAFTCISGVAFLTVLTCHPPPPPACRSNTGFSPHGHAQRFASAGALARKTGSLPPQRGRRQAPPSRSPSPKRTALTSRSPSHGLAHIAEAYGGF